MLILFYLGFKEENVKLINLKGWMIKHISRNKQHLHQFFTSKMPYWSVCRQNYGARKNASRKSVIFKNFRIHFNNHSVSNVLRKWSMSIKYRAMICVKYFFFFLGFLSRTFTIHRTAWKGGKNFLNSFLQYPPASQTPASSPFKQYWQKINCYTWNKYHMIDCWISSFLPLEDRD